MYGCGGGTFGNQGNGGGDVREFTKRAENVAQVACSDYTTWYVTTTGDLYGCGINRNGQQSIGGTEPDRISVFTKRAENVSKVFCDPGDYGTANWYITTTGDLYGCGIGYNGQQGNGYDGDEGQVNTFTKRAENVKDFICGGSSTSWYLTNNGELYGCGGAYYGQQGNGGDYRNPNEKLFEKKSRKCQRFCSFLPYYVVY